MPLLAYHFFIDKFVDAIRYEIARSAERAYDSLKLADMPKMFMIADQQQLAAFNQSNNDKSDVKWEMRDNRMHFLREKKHVEEIPNERMMQYTLGYATELNRII